MLTRHLVLGGARSGKSRFAERLVSELADAVGREQVYLATGQAGDGEMAERIEHHQQQRSGVAWTLVEEPLHVAEVLRTATANQAILIDCLTLWLANVQGAGLQSEWSDTRAAFVSAVSESAADVVMVSNEVGLGVVPLGSETRWFVDEVGRLHQALASVCTHVTLVAAGLPLVLKDSS